MPKTGAPVEEKRHGNLRHFPLVCHESHLMPCVNSISVDFAALNYRRAALRRAAGACPKYLVCR